MERQAGRHAAGRRAARRLAAHLDHCTAPPAPPGSGTQRTPAAPTPAQRCPRSSGGRRRRTAQGRAGRAAAPGRLRRRCVGAGRSSEMSHCSTLLLDKGSQDSFQSRSRWPNSHTSFKKLSTAHLHRCEHRLHPLSGPPSHTLFVGPRSLPARCSLPPAGGSQGGSSCGAVVAITQRRGQRR